MKSSEIKRKKSLQPKLRFPEFVDFEEWEEKKVEELFNLQDGYAFSSNEFVDNPINSFQVIRITDINNHNKNRDKIYIPIHFEGESEFKKYIAKKGDLLLSLTGAAGFNFFIWNSNPAIINQRTMKISLKDDSNNALKVLLGPLICDKINAHGSGQNNNLSKESLRGINFLIPKPAEQQKIADCLSSLNELIEAENQKLEALQRHKKGLMQELFPAEGQTIPKRRFPEFQSSPEWEKDRLGNHIEEFRQQSRIQDEYETLTSSRVGLIRQRDYYDNSRITERDNIGFNIIPPNYITYRSRSDDELFFFNLNNLGITGLVSIYYPVFRIANGDNYFFTNLFSLYGEYIGRSSVGNAQKVLSLNELRKIILPIPSPSEQKKIGAMISSINDLITTQGQKLTSLRLHKKGLMQQLFPNVSEAQG